MIQFSFSLHRSRDPKFRSLFEVTRKLSKHKVFECQAYTDRALLHVNASIQFGGCDHAGPVLELGLLGVMLVVRVYDSRHWDYNKHQWAQYDYTD